jgi:hypothetical protein
MIEFIDKAVMLKTVREHEDRFLGLWVLDCLVEERGFFEKLTVDLAADGAAGPDIASSGPDGWSINH